MKKISLVMAQIFIISVILYGFATVATAGKIQQQLAAESTIERALRRGVLRVGMSTFFKQ